MLKRFVPILGLAGLGLTVLPAQAQLSSASSQFTGTAPNICQVGSPIQANTAMNVTGGGNGLSGETSPFSFVSNTPVDLQLRSVTVDKAPDGSNGSYQAGLVEAASKAEVLQASNTNASGLKRYAQPLVTTDTFSMRLAIAAPKGGMLTAGNYVSTVTVDCLSPI
jgi:hypothetical protein